MSNSKINKQLKILLNSLNKTMMTTNLKFIQINSNKIDNKLWNTIHR
jgi:hypothetical protein